MIKYYEVMRTQTCKAIGSKDGYSVWNADKKQFATIAEVKAFLKEEYGNCKKEKMYLDESQNGSIYCYNTPKTSYDDTPKNNQDWVEVREIKATTIII